MDVNEPVVEETTEKNSYGIEPESYAELEENHPKLYKNTSSGQAPKNPFDGGGGLELVEVEVILDGYGANVTAYCQDIIGYDARIIAFAKADKWGNYNEDGQYIRFNEDWAIMYPDQSQTGGGSNHIKLLLPKSVMGLFGYGYSMFAQVNAIFGGTYDADEFWFTVTSADCVSNDSFDVTTTITSSGTIHLVLETSD